MSFEFRLNQRYTFIRDFSDIIKGTNATFVHRSENNLLFKIDGYTRGHNGGYSSPVGVCGTHDCWYIHLDVAVRHLVPARTVSGDIDIYKKEVLP